MSTRHAIFAQSQSGHIGRKGNHPLLWRLKGDLPRFKDLTHDNAMIMGRYTYMSLPGKLPGRLHVIVSTSLPLSLNLEENLAVVDNLEAAFRLCDQYGYEEQFVIGGGDLINQAIPYCHFIHRTVVKDKADDLSGMALVDLPDQKPYWGRFHMTKCEVDENPTHWYETYEQSQPKEPTKV